MCGIVGYIGKKEALPILIKGIQRLEYRGYDSLGVCLQKDKAIHIAKRKGTVESFKKLPELKNLQGNIGIGHTRWATHGIPSQRNAHPHTDCNQAIAIVHNGIIENYQSLKDVLLKEGHKIVSQTDSEIIAHLIENFYQGNLEEAVVKAVNLLEGTFGLAVVHKDKDNIIAVRRGSPLAIGIGQGEMFLASDVSAILEYTKQVVYLKDNQLALIRRNSFQIKNLDGQKVKKEVKKIKWSLEQIEKKGHKHFMAKEIFEQPETIKDLLRGKIKNNRIKLSLKLKPKDITRIIITACGTSWHAALVGKYFIEHFARIPVAVDYASEFRYRNPLIKQSDLVIGISQSGETADTLEAIREAKRKQAATLGIINVVGSTISREVDSGIFIHAGPEIGVASTKAFTAQLTSLLLLALYLRQEKGSKINKAVLSELKNLPDNIKTALSGYKEIKELAEHFYKSKGFFYLARGINFPIALEGALKLKEISYIPTEGYPAGEMKHGPIALIDQDFPTVFLAPRSLTLQKIISNIQEIKARKGRVIIITNSPQSLKRLSQFIIRVPLVSEWLSPIINTIPVQLFAYYIADLKGCNIDKPRNLAKSVTVE
jgi:glucosamine--fructose-6-phosphate aminotransferase (isomerizing)